MQVQDLFKRLSYGELSNLSIGNEGAGTIADGKEAQVLSAIQLALTTIYARFQHRVSSLVLEATEGVSSYVLDSQHAESDTTSSPSIPRYIKDVTEMPAPYPDDLIKILSVVRRDRPETPNVDEARPFQINSRRNQENAAKVLAYNEFRLLSAKLGDLFDVEYQAKHPTLALGGSIQIMPALEEALQARAAAAIFSGMTGETHVARSQELLARYEALCQMVLLNDMAQESGSDDYDRLRARGWV